MSNKVVNSEQNMMQGIQESIWAVGAAVEGGDQVELHDFGLAEGRIEMFSPAYYAACTDINSWPTEKNSSRKIQKNISPQEIFCYRLQHPTISLNSSPSSYHSKKFLPHSSYLLRFLSTTVVNPPAAPSESMASDYSSTPVKD